jgi:xanthine/CO dehydrogenase XdhC/CoxF family maturation factor
MGWRMSEWRAILAAIAAGQVAGEPMFLATVVQTTGSTYRRPGARMLIRGDEFVGTISGGCLESDVVEYTRQRMSSGEPIVVTYDMSADTDLIWGFGIGCNGTVQVLIERLQPEYCCDPIAFIQSCYQQRQPGVLVTVFAAAPTTTVAVGSRMMVLLGKTTTDITEPALTAQLMRDGALTRSQVRRYDWATGWAEVLIEVIEPPLPLLLIGAGRDAVPLAQLAQGLGWEVTVVDGRASAATPERFAFVDRVVQTRREVLAQDLAAVGLDDRTVAVVMTHNYFDDRAALECLLPSPVQYVGLLGSRDRTQRLLEEVRSTGLQVTPEQYARLYAPVGLDIGADTPETIALAIVAEIQRVVTRQSGHSLREERRSRRPASEFQSS